MGKNAFAEELINDIEESRVSIVRNEEIFNSISEQIKAISPEAFNWMKSGFDMDQYWNQHTIDNAQEYLHEQRIRQENYRKGAIKAAITRKANKLKTA